jgi:Raf kinase inhibitor-like YbhB/YbcL family protein
MTDGAATLAEFHLTKKTANRKLLFMKSYCYRIVAGAALLLTIFFVEIGKSEDQDSKGRKGMKITSSAFQEGTEIPAKYSRQGENTNPPLRIEGAPENAKSLVLIVDDPDAPVGLFTHWLLWNIDPKTTEIAEKSTPKGAVQGTNDYPTLGYGGPQPPSGTHRYYFKIYALDQTLNLRAGAKRKELEKEMSGHVIAQGQLMGRYTRQK